MNNVKRLKNMTKYIKYTCYLSFNYEDFKNLRYFVESRKTHVE